MNVVTYLRVSTARQGESGLGLEAQEAAIQAYCKANSAKVIGRYVEIESGKRADRPELLKALSHAKRAKATLLVAKLDRLARNVAFLSALMESGAPFIACDNPHANRLTIHILAAVAEAEAAAISARTKAALAARRARGEPLGAEMPNCRNLPKDAHVKGSTESARTRRRMTLEAYSDLIPIVQALRQQGLTLQQIASQLNQEGQTTRTGAQFAPMTVARLLELAR